MNEYDKLFSIHARLFGDRPDIVLILQVGVVRLLLHTWLLPLLMETTITLDVPPNVNTNKENEFQTRNNITYQLCGSAHPELCALSQ